MIEASKNTMGTYKKRGEPVKSERTSLAILMPQEFEVSLEVLFEVPFEVLLEVPFEVSFEVQDKSVRLSVKY